MVTAQLISPFVFITKIVKLSTSLNQSFKPLAILCGCTARFMSDMAGNPKNRFSRDADHINKDLTPCLLVLSADNFCKQFGPRSGNR